MPEPVTTGGVLGGAALAGAFLKGLFSNKHDDSAVMERLGEIEAKLHADHESNRNRVEAMQSDLADIKVDVAIVKTEVSNLKERA